MGAEYEAAARGGRSIRKWFVDRRKRTHVRGQEGGIQALNPPGPE